MLSVIPSRYHQLVELRHLRYFVALAEELHFSRTAQRLHLAQPALSQRIKDLERELGLKLFDRTHHSVQLTEAGALLLEQARPVVEGADAAREAMRRIRPGRSGALRAGIPPDTYPSTLRRVLAGFESRMPGVLLELHESTTSEQLIGLREGDLDVGIIRHPVNTIGLESGPMLSRRMGVVLHVNHPAAQADRVKLKNLAGSALVTFPREMAPVVYDDMLNTMRDHGYLPTAIRHARNPDFVHGLVLGGRGIHINQRPVSPLPRGLTWRPLASNPLFWRTSTVWVATRHSSVIKAFTLIATQSLIADGYRRARN